MGSRRDDGPVHPADVAPPGGRAGPVAGHHGGMTDAERLRRRIEEIFGDEPATPGDERADGGAADEREEGSADRWLRENRPPHHGG